MPKVVVALVVGVMLVAAAVPLAWGGRVVDTRLKLPVWSESPRHQGRTRLSAYAQIHSKPACQHRRQAKLYFQKRRGRRLRLADSDRSSRHGAIALTGRVRFRPYKFVVKVRSKRISRRHPFTCGTARLAVNTRHP
jgi:hypothetical protein